MHYRVFWYRIVQWFSGLFAWRHHVKPVSAISEIPERLSWGQRYKADRKGGDRFYHPRRVQMRIDRDVRVGDCEDHAGYWIACLLKSGLARRAWLGAVFFVRNGVEGHAVCIFEDHDGKFWWCDYGMPNAFDAEADSASPGWEWALAVSRAFGASHCRRAEIYKVRGLEDDALKFDFRGVDRKKLGIRLTAPQ